MYLYNMFQGMFLHSWSKKLSFWRKVLNIYANYRYSVTFWMHNLCFSNSSDTNNYSKLSSLYTFANRYNVCLCLWEMSLWKPIIRSILAEARIFRWYNPSTSDYFPLFNRNSKMFPYFNHQKDQLFFWKKIFF